MSSILEALRELERRRPPATQSAAAPAEPPSSVHRAVATLGIGAIGLVVGALVLLLSIWISSLVRAPALPLAPAPPTQAPAPPTQAPAPPTQAPADDAQAPAPSHLAWLDKVDPPRARIDRGAPAAPERPARSLAGRQDRVMAEPPASDAETPASAPGQLEVATIDYSPDAARRAVTLRLNGASVVTLREHESAHGIEVQLIQPDGVYVRRGAEVFMLAPRR